MLLSGDNSRVALSWPVAAGNAGAWHSAALRAGSAKSKRRVTLKSGGLLISSSSAAAALRRAGQSSFFCLNFCNDRV